jgi:hypothetical protein
MLVQPWMMPAISSRRSRRAGGRGEAGIAHEVRPPDDLAEALPHRIARPGDDGHVAIRRRIDAGAGSGERDIAGAREQLAADRVSLAEVVEGDQQAVEQREVDALPLAAAIAVVQGRHDAEGAEHARVVVGDGLARARGRVVREAGDAHVAADRLGQHVVAPLLGIGAVLPERGDGGVDQARIHLLQVLVPEAEALHRAEAPVLGHDVGAGDQLLEQLGALRRLQLERDAELVAVPVLRGRHALLDAVAHPLHAERHALAPAVARFDLDHPRAHVGEQHGAEGHGDDLSQVDHRDVAQRLIHRAS